MKTANSWTRRQGDDAHLDDPSNFLGSSHSLSGYKALWFAVLRDATVRYARGACPKHLGTAVGNCRACNKKRNTGTFKEVLSWFLDDSEETASYRWVCHILGIDWEWLWDHKQTWSRVAQTGQRAYRRSSLRQLIPGESESGHDGI